MNTASNSLTRPTGRRLGIALGIATIAVAGLLHLAALLSAGSPGAMLLAETTGTPLTVSIERPRRERTLPEKRLPAPTDDPLTESSDMTAAGDTPVRSTSAPSRTAIPVGKPRVDLQAIADEAIRKRLESHAADAAVSSRQWRESFSVMFEPGDDVPVLTEAPLLDDFRFKPEVHVAGLGLTIGSCFFGIPLVGVPVEERTVALRLIVCASDAG